ncbi:MAG: hypothetical protein ACKVOB_02045 [Sphingomonas sp.]
MQSFIPDVVPDHELPLPYLANSEMVAEASALMEQFGSGALLVASMRASEARTIGNVLRFCHWRQQERLIAVLASDTIFGSIQ